MNLSRSQFKPQASKRKIRYATKDQVLKHQDGIPAHSMNLLGLDIQATPVFKTRAEHDKFREEFSKQVEPQLRRLRIARQKSEVWAMTRFVN